MAWRAGDDFSATAVGKLFLCSSLVCFVLSTCGRRSNGDLDAIPITQKLPEQSADENADDDVPIEVHGQKHDEVCHGKGRHMDDRANELLKWRWSECNELIGIAGRIGWTTAVLRPRVRKASCNLPLKLLSDVRVILLP